MLRFEVPQNSQDFETTRLTYSFLNRQEQQGKIKGQTEAVRASGKQSET